jgi:thiosulfate dehydrogenase (quinone) large subunit
MTKQQKISLFILRITMGWLFFYAGITKILADNWSAAFYLKDAEMFAPFYNFLLQPDILPYVNFLNKWGLTLIGVALIFGVFSRIAAYAGAAMMILYYFPILNFPYPNEHAYIVDEHIIYAAALLVLGFFDAGRVYTFKDKLAKIWKSKKLGV